MAKQTYTLIALLFLTAATLGGVGCGPIKVPDFPPALQQPVVQVTAVELVDQSEQASSYRVHVRLENPNAFELPLTDAKYTVNIGGGSYSADFPPNRTLPANRDVDVLLPAVVAGGGAGSYDVSGTLEMSPPHEMRQLMYDLGIPRPRVAFAGQGTVGPASMPPTPRDTGGEADAAEPEPAAGG